MCDAPTTGHRELWQAVSFLPADLGPEENVVMWREAEDLLDNLYRMHQEYANEAVQTALVDCSTAASRSAVGLRTSSCSASGGAKGGSAA